MLTENQKKWLDSIKSHQNLIKLLNEAKKLGKIKFSQYKEIINYKLGGEINLRKWRKK